MPHTKRIKQIKYKNLIRAARVDYPALMIAAMSCSSSPNCRKCLTQNTPKQFSNKTTWGQPGVDHPALMIAAMSCESKPHCRNVSTGFGASKPETLIPSCRRLSLTCGNNWNPLSRKYVKMHIGASECHQHSTQLP
jgi:hypothetical protein